MKARWLAAAAAGSIAASSTAFALTQHVGPVTAMYWAVTTAATVGYGDVAPHSTSARIVAILTMLTTVPILGMVFARVTSHHTSRRLKHTEATHRIIADLHKHVTGEDHPHAPSDE